jgi:hyperosmotically inducible periplasmic protein
MQRWKLFTATAMVVTAMLMLVGCAAMSSRESIGESREDAAITANVKSSFVADPQVRTSPINVETTRGVVYLSGTVSSEQERAQAIRLAQGVAGVREIIVRNLIVHR